MDENVSEYKKLSDEPEGISSSSADDNGETESKSNSTKYGRPSRRPVWSNSLRKRSNFGKVGFRKPGPSRSASLNKGKRPLHERARTLMHLSHVHDLPTSPPANVSRNKDTVDIVAELRTVLDGLSEQINQMERRFDKQLGAFHKRFEKMEKMQLTILANIRKFSRSDESTVKTMQEDARSKEMDMISEHIL